MAKKQKPIELAKANNKSVEDKKMEGFKKEYSALCKKYGMGLMPHMNMSLIFTKIDENGNAFVDAPINK